MAFGKLDDGAKSPRDFQTPLFAARVFSAPGTQRLSVAGQLQELGKTLFVGEGRRRFSLAFVDDQPK